MVGGDAAVFEKAKDVLSGMGRRLVHCGGPGMGQAAKICNNMLLGISMAGVSECFNLGMRYVLFIQSNICYFFMVVKNNFL